MQIKFYQKPKQIKCVITCVVMECLMQSISIFMLLDLITHYLVVCLREEILSALLPVYFRLLIISKIYTLIIFNMRVLLLTINIFKNRFSPPPFFVYKYMQVIFFMSWQALVEHIEPICILRYLGVGIGLQLFQAIKLLSL